MDSERGSPVIQFREVQGPLLASMGTHVCMGVYTYACMRVCVCVCVCAHIYPDRDRKSLSIKIKKNRNAFFFFSFSRHVCWCSCPRTRSIDQAGLKPRDLPASASPVLRLKGNAIPAHLEMPLKLHRTEKTTARM
jgi:hypothetical protein